MLLVVLLVFKIFPDLGLHKLRSGTPHWFAAVVKWLQGKAAAPWELTNAGGVRTLEIVRSHNSLAQFPHPRGYYMQVPLIAPGNRSL